MRTCRPRLWLCTAVMPCAQRLQTVLVLEQQPSEQQVRPVIFSTFRDASRWSCSGSVCCPCEASGRGQRHSTLRAAFSGQRSAPCERSGCTRAFFGAHSCRYIFGMSFCIITNQLYNVEARRRQEKESGGKSARWERRPGGAARGRGVGTPLPCFQTVLSQIVDNIPAPEPIPRPPRAEQFSLAPAAYLPRAAPRYRRF